MFLHFVAPLKFLYMNIKLHTSLFPNGTTVKNTSGVARLFPSGLVGDGIVSEKVVGTEIPLGYELFDGNIFTLGLEDALLKLGLRRLFCH